MPMRYFTQEQLGETQSLTPEGFLLCENVPLARIGEMLYADGEVPVTAKDGVIRIHRSLPMRFSTTGPLHRSKASQSLTSILLKARSHRRISTTSARV